MSFLVWHHAPDREMDSEAEEGDTVCEAKRTSELFTPDTVNGYCVLPCWRSDPESSPLIGRVGSCKEQQAESGPLCATCSLKYVVYAQITK